MNNTNKTKICDGVSLHIINSKKFKTTSVSILLRRTLSRNEVTLNALLPNILKRGSDKYRQLTDIYRHTDNMYGAIFDATIIKKGEEQLLQFFIEVIKKDDLTLQGLEFLLEILLNPLVCDGGFKAEIVEGEKENLKKAILSRTNDKKEYAKLRCLEETCKSEPFGIYGDGYIEDLEKINNINLFQHYKELLATSPIEIVVIGEEDSCSISNFLKEKLTLSRYNIKYPPIPSLNYEKKKETIIKEKMDITQGKLCISIRTGVSQTGGDFYNLLVGNELFGGSANSMLFTNIREKESLCYYINSVVYKFKTIVLLQSGIDAKYFKKAVSLINMLIERVACGHFSDDDLNNAKASVIKKLDSIEDDPTAAMDYYVSQYMLNNSCTLDAAREQINKVTCKDISEVFKKLYIDTVCLLT